jgi:excisionase family DNA binding protein
MNAKTTGYLVTQGELLPLAKQLAELLEDTIAQAVSKAVQEVQGEEFITTQEVCNILNISVPTLRKRRLDGKISYYKEGKTIRFKRSEILGLAKKQNLFSPLSKVA